MTRQHWPTAPDGYVHMTRGGYPHKVLPEYLDAVLAGTQVPSCFCERQAAHDWPLPPHYTGRGKSGTMPPPKVDRVVKPLSQRKTKPAVQELGLFA